MTITLPEPWQQQCRTVQRRQYGGTDGNYCNKFTNNHPKRYRILIDTAALSNFITQNLVDILRLQQQALSVGRLGNIETLTANNLTATIKSRYNDY